MDHYNEFRRRWNIPNEEDAFPKFKIGILNTLEYNLKPIYSGTLNHVFCSRALIKDNNRPVYSTSDLYFKISGTGNLADLLFHLEIIINIIKEAIDKSEELGESSERFVKAKEMIVRDIKRLVGILPINLTMKEEKKSVLFYPSGAELLDEKLVNDPLTWLSDYPKAHANFRGALEKYQKGIHKRNLLDDLRSSLEIFLKEYLDNKKSLENQREELFKYMKEKGVSKEISAMFWTLLDAYSRYQNEYVKHNDNVKEQEIEFMIYTTGNFIRFMITLKDK